MDVLLSSLLDHQNFLLLLPHIIDDPPLPFERSPHIQLDIIIIIIIIIQLPIVGNLHLSMRQYGTHKIDLAPAPPPPAASRGACGRGPNESSSLLSLSRSYYETQRRRPPYPPYPLLAPNFHRSRLPIRLSRNPSPDCSLHCLVGLIYTISTIPFA